ncbi:MAG: LytR C-terminal domain-containing protein [Aeriscardovia sp.]|nr:LytR C-terminal domain-containing protein [Aeriscardovia sp.]MBP5786159.1 LytR C-terminal domain-containing protein [Aeriscardovia sp.]
MAPPAKGPDRSEQQARKEYVKDRQKLVFRFCGIALAVILVIALLGYFGVFGLIAPHTVENQKNNFGVTAPCAPSGSKALSSSNITLEVLNGTSNSGLADAVGEALYFRGFNVDGIGDANNSSVAHTTIYAGKNALAAAYTLRAQLTSSILELDNSTGNDVILVIGNDFYDLKPASSVTLKEGQALSSIQGCKVASQIQDSPTLSEIGEVVGPLS